MKLPQLTLRDLFWLVALVAVGCGWWADRWQLQGRSDSLASLPAFGNIALFVLVGFAIGQCVRTYKDVVARGDSGA